MSGFFGVVSKKDCAFPLFYGVDYHSHLGTKRGGLAVYGEEGFVRTIHNIENSPFRTKFETDIELMHGNLGIGCISDNEPQPLLINSKLGSFAICTVGRINNLDDLINDCYSKGNIQFTEMTKGRVNPTEVIAALINQKNTIEEGIQYAQDVIDGSSSMLLLFSDRIIAARDKFGRTPIVIGENKDGYCVTFENSAFINLGFKFYKELGPGEIVSIKTDKVEVLKEPNKERKICSFLWTYYGYPTSTYEGVGVEAMRYRCGELMRQYDEGLKLDYVAGIPDSGLAHAIGYSNCCDVPFARPFMKYTPTWARSFMPAAQNQRNLIAHMKLIPVYDLIKNKKLLLIDDSIVRGTQLRETVDFLYDAGVDEVHVRLACPPIMYGCKYLNFSRSNSDLELIARKTVCEIEGTEDVPQEILDQYIDWENPKHKELIDAICKKMNFTSLRYYRIEDLYKAIGIDKCNLCTYCFNGKE